MSKSKIGALTGLIFRSNLYYKIDSILKYILTHSLIAFFYITLLIIFPILKNSIMRKNYCNKFNLLALNELNVLEVLKTIDKNNTYKQKMMKNEELN